MKDLKSIRQCMYCHSFCKFACPSYMATKDQKILQNQKNYLFYLASKGIIEPEPGMGRSFFLCNDCKRCEYYCWYDKKDVLSINRSAREFAILKNIAPKEIIKIHSNLVENGRIYSWRHQKKVQEKLEPYARKRSTGKNKIPDIYIYIGDYTRSFGIESFLSFIRILDYCGIEYVFDLDEISDGTLALDLGMRDTGIELMEKNYTNISRLRSSRIVVMDPESYYGLKVEYRNNGYEFDREIIHYTSMLEEISGQIKTKRISSNVKYFDPCKMSRYMKECEAPRNVLKSLFGLEKIDFFKTGEESWCCGGFIGLFDRDVSDRIAGNIIEDCIDDKCEIILTSCALGVYNLKSAAKKTNIHIYNLADFIEMNITG
jgi:Fe-S oxidoreductase